MIFRTGRMCAAGLVLSVCAGGGAWGQSDEQQIQTLMAEYAQAHKLLDVDHMDRLWVDSDAATIIVYSQDLPEPNIEIHGWSEVRRSLSLLPPDEILEYGDVEVAIDGKTASASFELSGLAWGSGVGYMRFTQDLGDWRISVLDLTGIWTSRTGDDDGTFYMAAFEAEAGAGASPFAVGDATASEGEYVVDMGSITYSFDTPNDGSYTVWARTLAAHNGANSLHFSGAGGSAVWDVAISHTWVWSQVNNRSTMGPRIDQYRSGAQAVEVNSREPGTKLDALFITDNLSLRADQVAHYFAAAMAEGGMATAVRTDSWGAVKAHAGSARSNTTR